MRIMTNRYVRGKELEIKYRNMDQREIANNEEYAKYIEEETNTKKMSSILKNLNSPKRRD